jgi:hypothetical protein
MSCNTSDVKTKTNPMNAHVAIMALLLRLMQKLRLPLDPPPLAASYALLSARLILLPVSSNGVVKLPAATANEKGAEADWERFRIRLGMVASGDCLLCFVFL